VATLASVRPMIHTQLVGASYRRTPAGSSPDQPGPTIAKSPALLPVVRVPGLANTSPHMS
jgi:hypothetical protein